MMCAKLLRQRLAGTTWLLESGPLFAAVVEWYGEN